MLMIGFTKNLIMHYLEEIALKIEMGDIGQYFSGVKEAVKT